jgi:outer membrane lipoprotein-sorting protein
MNDEHRFPNFDGLEPPLEAAVKVALEEPIPEDAIDRVKARAKLLAATTGSPTHTRGSRHRSRKATSFSDGRQADTARPTFPTHCVTTWTKWMMRSSACRIAAAAVLVFAIAGVALWFHVSGTPSAFAEFIKPILEAKSAKFKATFERNGKQVATANGMWLAPNRERMELQEPGQPMEIRIADTGKGVGVRIDAAKKTVVINKVVGLPRELTSMDPLEEIRSLLRDAGKRDVKRQSLGEKEVDGRRAVGWRVSGPGLHEPGVTAAIWGDPETGLPIRIESYSALEGVKSTLSDFVFNVDLDESLFSIEPPTGYTVQTVEVDASQPREKDLITLLCEYGKLMNNAFPESLDMDRLLPTLQVRISVATTIPGNERPSDEVLHKIAKARTEEETGKIIEAERRKNEKKEQAELLRLMRNGKSDKIREMGDAAKNARQKAMKAFTAKWTDVYMIITRGLGFVVELPREADAHYAGKGVSLGAPGTPIFWYRPKDAKNYRVIFADLTVREATTPPSMPNAQPVVAPPRPKK